MANKKLNQPMPMDVPSKPSSHKQILQDMHTSAKQDISYGKEQMLRGHAKMIGAKMMLTGKAKVPSLTGKSASGKLGFKK